MANPTNAIDLWEEDEAFATRFAPQLVKKHNLSAQYDEDDIGDRATSEWGDWVDDFILECKAAARYAPQPIDGVPDFTAWIGALVVDRTNGDLYINTTGEDDGWMRLALSSEAASDHGTLTGLGDDDHPQYALSGAIGSSRLTTNGGPLLLGRYSVTGGAPQEVALDGVFDLTVGGDLNIADGGITNSLFRDGGACSVVGRASNSGGDVADISAGTNDRVLARAANALAFQQVSDAMHVDAAALSLKGRSANSTGVMGDIVAGTDGHVARRSGTSLGFGLLAAGAFATSPGIITPAMLDNGSARSVLGVTGGSAAARADIASSSDDTFIVRRSGSIVWDGITSADLTQASQTIYEIDFSTLSTNDYADGTESIDSIDWTCVNRASSTLFETTSGIGIRWSIPASTARTFLSGSQTSAYIYTTLGAIFTRAGRTRDGNASYVLDFYFSSLVREQNGETPVVGIWDATNTTLRAGSIRQNGGAYNVGQQQSSSVYSTVDVGSGANVISIRFDPNGAGCVSYGTWSSGWPAVDAEISTAAVGNGSLATFSRSATRVVIAGGITASDASPTTAWTLHNMRLRKVG